MDGKPGKETMLKCPNTAEPNIPVKNARANATNIFMNRRYAFKRFNLRKNGKKGEKYE